ncbi:MAG: Gfo/Idh/MocA family oxidoreductase [Clostridiales bacterium]|nr:Gfo/Idh/MocA family oxidoreductase [Clostridiales bacterium]
MIRTVLIGTEGHFEFAINAIRNGTQAKIVAISSGSDDKMRNEVVKVLNVPVYDDYIQMLDEAHPDLVIINPKFQYISECAVASIKRNMAIFCEKPLSITQNGLNDIKKATKNSKSRICAMMGMRSEAPFLKLHEIIQSGDLGDLRLFHAQKSYKLGERPEYYRDRATYGGTIPWVGSHPIDMIYWLSGRKKYTSITAKHSKISNHNHGDLEATAAMLFEMEDEIIATVNIDYLRPSDSITHGDDHIRVMGDKCWAEIVDGKLFCNNEQIVLGDDGNIFDDLCRELQGKATCSITNEDSIYITDVCLKARESADKQMKMQL